MEDYSAAAASNMAAVGRMILALPSAVMPPPDTPWTLRAIAERAAETLRHDGVKALWFRVLGELGYRRAVLFELDFARHRPGEAIPANVRFEPLSSNNIEDLLKLMPRCDEHEVRRRQTAGHACMLGYVDGKPAYINWITQGLVRIDYLGIQALLSPGAGYGYGLYVDPAFRGLGLPRIGLDVRIPQLRERGLTKWVAIVVPENRAGVHHVLRCGFQLIGRMYCLKVGRLKRCWMRTLVEPAPLRLVG